jgi:hypothetical protein
VHDHPNGKHRVHHAATSLSSRWIVSFGAAPSQHSSRAYSTVPVLGPIDSTQAIAGGNLRYCPVLSCPVPSQRSRLPVSSSLLFRSGCRASLCLQSSPPFLQSSPGPCCQVQSFLGTPSCPRFPDRTWLGWADTCPATVRDSGKYCTCREVVAGVAARLTLYCRSQGSGGIRWDEGMKGTIS